MEARTATAFQRVCDDEQSRGFHFAGFDTQTFPRFPFLQQFIGNGHFCGAVLTVESVFALDNARMRRFAHGQGRLAQSNRDIQVRNGGVFYRSIFLRRVFKADCSRRDDDIARLNV